MENGIVSLMPSKFVLRDFTENAVYHIYNRGVEKRAMFLDMQDFRVFIFYLYIYLSQPDQVKVKYPDLPPRLRGKNLAEQVQLVGYCLMPNHFHLLMHQVTKDGISKVMRQVMNGYTLYFNHKYQRVGGLVAGRFRSVRVHPEHLVLLVRYLHLNPVITGICTTPEDYEWSSFRNYTGSDGALEVDKRGILKQFETVERFREFSLDRAGYAREKEAIRHLTIEEEI